MIVTREGDWFSHHTDCTPETRPEDMDDCIALYNTDLVDPIHQALMVVTTGLTAVYIMLCIACYWNRDLAMHFIHLEALIRIVASFIPNTYFSRDTSMDFMWTALLMFFCYYCDKIVHIVTASILLVF